MRTILYFSLALACALPGVASAKNYCGTLDFHYGPYDYRTDKGKLPIVDRAHFTEEIENGIRGNTDELGGDLHYTLGAFPNHHRALATLVRIALRDKAVHIRKMKYAVECYFVRAQQFAPTDATARALHGSYLYGTGKHDRALAAYQEAIVLDPDNPMINYNIALAYLKKNDFEQALAHAHKAYAQAYPLPGLKNQLIKAGKWTDLPFE